MLIKYVYLIADLMFFIFYFTFYYFTVFSLQVLLLRNNALTDEGIRKWTAPIRVKKTGPKNLQILDLSGIPFAGLVFSPYLGSGSYMIGVVLEKNIADHGFLLQPYLLQVVRPSMH